MAGAHPGHWRGLLRRPGGMYHRAHICMTESARERRSCKRCFRIRGRRRGPPFASDDTMIEVTEVSIAELCAALEFGRITVVELVKVYLVRIDVYDGLDTPIRLNAVVVRNPDVLKEVEVSDICRVCGEMLSSFDGIFYIVKDSYLVKGLMVVFGSSVFKDLVVQRDVFSVERLRAVGVICLGKINMLLMVNGGMQCGVYGRVESSYNVDYLMVPVS